MRFGEIKCHEINNELNLTPRTLADTRDSVPPGPNIVFGERVPVSHGDRRPWVTLVVARSQGRWTRSQLRP